MNGLFIGSFDMFTKGHLETLEQAVPFNPVLSIFGLL